MSMKVEAGTMLEHMHLVTIVRASGYVLSVTLVVSRGLSTYAQD